jgi:hypothetical protein
VGRPELARGRYSIVLEGEPDRVFKIVTHPDEYLFYTADDRPQGPHFPVIYTYHGIIGRSKLGYPVHLFEMERLLPLPEQSPAGQLARRLASVYWEEALAALSRFIPNSTGFCPTSSAKTG